MNEQELNRKLAENLLNWQDIIFLPYGDGKLEMSGKLNGIYQVWMQVFTQSLDACFKWLVPKLVDAKLEYSCRSNPNNPDSYYAHLHDGRYGAIGKAEEPALALCLAIEKLIDAASVAAPKETANG